VPKQQAGESLATIVWIYHQAGNQYHTRMMLEFDDAAQNCFGACAKKFGFSLLYCSATACQRRKTSNIDQPGLDCMSALK
jgi:hypothetical protein